MLDKLIEILKAIDDMEKNHPELSEELESLKKIIIFRQT